MTLNETFSYLEQLLNACWSAFQLQIWGNPIWYYLAAILILSLTVKFLKGIFNRDADSGGDKR